MCIISRESSVVGFGSLHGNEVAGAHYHMRVGLDTKPFCTVKACQRKVGPFEIDS